MFFTKNQNSDKNQSFVKQIENWNFGQKLAFWSKIGILVGIGILVKN